MIGERQDDAADRTRGASAPAPTGRRAPRGSGGCGQSATRERASRDDGGVNSSGLRRALDRIAREERGDVPGWVLITMMTAGLVVLLWALAGPALQGVFENAIAKVSGI